MSDNPTPRREAALAAERAWATFTAHQRSCPRCHALGDFRRLQAVDRGPDLPDELCARGRTLLTAWLTFSVAP